MLKLIRVQLFTGGGRASLQTTTWCWLVERESHLLSQTPPISPLHEHMAGYVYELVEVT